MSADERIYLETLLGTKDNPGGLIGQALGTLEAEAQTAQSKPSKAEASKLAGVVLGQVAAVRKAAGI